METETKKDFSEEVQVLVAFIEQETSYKKMLYAVLQFCIEAKAPEEIAAMIHKESQGCALLHSPEIMIRWLMDEGGLQNTAKEDEPIAVRTTEAGLSALNFSDTSGSFVNEFRFNKPYCDVFSTFLNLCNSPKTHEELEDAMAGKEIFEGGNLVQAGFFICELEDAGAIRWDGKWNITDTGKNILSAIADMDHC